MTIPMPQADELSIGQVGRMRLATGRSSSPVCIAAIRRSAGLTDSGMSIVELLAQTSGIDIATYAAQHSMLPVTAIAYDQSKGENECAWSRSILRYKGMTTPRPNAYLCLSCVATDMSRKSYSYWRRQHQLPGAHFCLEHNEPLRFVEGKQAFDKQPAHVLELSIQSPLARDSDALTSKAVERFQSIGQALLVTTLNVRERQLRQALASRAASKGIRVWTNGTLPLLSDVAAGMFPMAWLADVLPGAETKMMGEYFSALDNAVRPTATTTGTAYCMAMAIMFDSAKQAFEYVINFSLPNLSELESQPKAKSKSIQRIYCEHRGRLDLVAAELGVSEEEALGRLVRGRADLLRRLGDTAELRALRKFASAGGLVGACREEGADLHTAESVIRLLIAEQGKALGQP